MNTYESGIIGSPTDDGYDQKQEMKAPHTESMVRTQRQADVSPVGDPPGVFSLCSKFAEDDYIKETVLAAAFHCSPRTIRRRVQEGALPPRDPVNRMWRVGNVKAWLADRAEREEKRVREYHAKMDNTLHT